MHNNIVTYEWPLNGSIHIAYETGDDHIHEMVMGQKGKWIDSDITRVAGGPELDNVMLAGSSWADGQTQQIAYTSSVDSSGHIYELVMYRDHPWSFEDIMLQPIGAAPADGFVLVAYSWRAGGTKNLVYTGRDGHVNELSAGVTGLWKYTDLTQAAGAPLAEGSLLAAYDWNAGGTKYVVYTSGDGHIHELVCGQDGRWRHTDLMATSEAPLASDSMLAAYTWEAGGTRQVVYTSNNGDVYELVCGQDGRWTYADVSGLTAAPLAAGTALSSFAWETGLSKEIVYVGSDRHIHELQMPLHGGWNHTDLTQLLGVPEASDDVIAGHEWTPEFAKLIAFLDTAENPHIHSLLLRHGGQWEYTDVTSFTGSQPLV
jgi:hypothetical protein